MNIDNYEIKQPNKNELTYSTNGEYKFNKLKIKDKEDN
jgi:hypothetical protein